MLILLIIKMKKIKNKGNLIDPKEMDAKNKN
jgi:hypothetical protein